MKKAALLILLLLTILPLPLFSVAEFWVLDNTDYIDPDTSVDKYRFNFQTVMDLSSTFNLPTYNSDYYGNEDYISSKNSIATVGLSGCEHKIYYEIDTGDGTFRSQSDRSKYRSFYVCASPDYTVYEKDRYGNITGVSRQYYYYDEAEGNYVSTNKNLPNTKSTNKMTIVAPITDGRTNSYYNRNRTAKFDAFGLDLFICMDPIEETDMYHIIEADDYIATINIRWYCKSGCADHQGSFTILVRGYFSFNDGADFDSYFITVDPTSDSMNLDIKALLGTNTLKKIADMHINTTTRRQGGNLDHKWRDHLKAFLSASPDYSSSTQRFMLRNMTDSSITIPYELTVKNSSDTSKSSTYKGTDSLSTDNFLNLYDYTKTDTSGYNVFVDRYQQTYYGINYAAEVDINILDKTLSVKGNNVLLSTILATPDNADSMETETYNAYIQKYSTYIGRYESTIYYHVVYQD